MLFGIIVAILIAVVVAVVLVTARSGVVSQAKHIVNAQRVTDVPRAKRVLHALSTTPKDLRTLEIDNLAEKLSTLIDKSENRQDKKETVGFKQR